MMVQILGITPHFKKVITMMITPGRIPIVMV